MITTIAVAADLKKLKLEFQEELSNILQYWLTYAIDHNQGGFYGEIGNDNKPVSGAIKGSVLNARILWSFSAAYRVNADREYLEVATRAYNYFTRYFVDQEHGGVFWSVTANGKHADAKKQIYAMAFAIYGLSEYYAITHDETALSQAIDLYQNIEKYSYDSKRGGYLEAFTRDWRLIEDLRLSDKDANEKKTMNTHLHILEAYTNLYRVWQSEELAGKIRGLIGDFEQYIVNTVTQHLNLFMDEDWNVKGDTVSYGHDIEASWLILEAAEVLNDEPLIKRIKQLSIAIARASAEGLNADGSLSYEFEPEKQHLVAERHWWVQAEAVVGYFNAWQLTGEQHYFDKGATVWAYTKQQIIDRQRGEWYWGVNADGTLMNEYGKAGFWKCPYHNSRACIEMVQRLNEVLDGQ